MFVTHENDDNFFHYKLGKGNDIKKKKYIQETNEKKRKTEEGKTNSKLSTTKCKMIDK